METAHAPTFAIVTPTYAPDFEHCRLLVESVQRYVPQHVKHYLIIDRKDEQLFSELHSPRTKILLKQEILPWWIHQLPFAPKWWISMRSLPIRGWIVQQLVKLSVNLALREDIYVFLDSGAMFVRPYDPATSVVDGMVPLFREQKDEVRLTWNTHWHQVAARLLGLPVLPNLRHQLRRQQSDLLAAREPHQVAATHREDHRKRLDCRAMPPATAQ